MQWNWNPRANENTTAGYEHIELQVQCRPYVSTFFKIYLWPNWKEQFPFLKKRIKFSVLRLSKEVWNVLSGQLAQTLQVIKVWSEKRECFTVIYEVKWMFFKCVFYTSNSYYLQFLSKLTWKSQKRVNKKSAQSYCLISWKV